MGLLTRFAVRFQPAAVRCNQIIELGIGHAVFFGVGVAAQG